MKKIIALLLACTIGAASFAQTETKTKDKEKVRKTSTVGQKVHNTFHKHHKHYNGYKVKHVKKVENK